MATPPSSVAAPPNDDDSASAAGCTAVLVRRRGKVEGMSAKGAGVRAGAAVEEFDVRRVCTMGVSTAWTPTPPVEWTRMVGRFHWVVFETVSK